MRKSFVALLLLMGAAASMANLALASEDGQFGDLANKLVNAHDAKGRLSRAARQGTAHVAALGATTWVGHAPTGAYQYGPFHIGTVSVDNSNSGGFPVNPSNGLAVWDWDHFNNNGNNGFPLENDSLQGWWPMRRAYGINGGLVQPDTQRPWWALDYGNAGNYVLNSQQQARTMGVVSYWHVDQGSNIPGLAAVPITWAPINGTGSAWAGLRAHGDNSHTEGSGPATNGRAPGTGSGNPYNATAVELVGETGAGSGTSKLLPGYINQMDQILYRDVLLNNVNASINLSFKYKTAMSTQANSTPGVQAGWFDFDPSTLGNTPAPNTRPNYIQNSAGTDPADSFMVYLGVPVDVNNYTLADGTTNHKVFDPFRRWLSEVVRVDKEIQEVLSVGGTKDVSAGTSVFKAAGALANIYNGSTDHYMRIVFRVKTNQSFSDQDAGVVGNYNSNHQGPVLLDDITISGDVNSGGGGPGAFNAGGDFEDKDGTSSINANLATVAHPLASWVGTGKPPAIFFHTHPLAGGFIGPGGLSNHYDPLAYNDLCGAPAPGRQRFCNLGGVVISAGTHDEPGEPAGGISGTDFQAEVEREDGILSPTVNLIPGDPTGVMATLPNAMGLDFNDVQVNDDIYVQYDLYAGVFNLNFTGNAWVFAFQAYPARQLDQDTGTFTGPKSIKVWGEIKTPTFQIFNPDVQCFTDQEAGFGNGLIKTSNASGIPDSIRIFLGKNQQCFRFGVPPSACSPTAGAYFDNVSLGINNGGAAAGGIAASVDIWRWVNDAFPVNESVVPGGSGSGLDTCAAYIKTGINIASSTGNANRYDIQGDSTLILVDNGAPERCDIVFRIKPGPGNFHIIGNINSGLRPVPTDAVNISAPGDGDPGNPTHGQVGDFWGQYMAHPGPFATGNATFDVPGEATAVGLHAGSQGHSGWNINVWNSARCDTGSFHGWRNNTTRSFRDDVTFAGLPQFAATYHESDEHYGTLGISTPICFQLNAAKSPSSANLKCDGTLPNWIVLGGAAPNDTTTRGYSWAYYNPPNQSCNNCTREGTKIIPSGLLVPGAHVEYFFRVSLAGNVATSQLVPDTTIVSPQAGEGSTDAHRWQEFSILPDRWKAFGGVAVAQPYDDASQMACMLYVDLNDRRGDERVWVSVADSIGATASARRGAHNGWKANGGEHYTDPLTGAPINVTGTDMQVASHGGIPGTTWEMYGVKASESLTTGGGAIGNRFGPQTQPTDYSYKKDAKSGPTQLELENYKVLFILSGDLNSGILGSFINRGQNDVKLLTNWITGTTNRSLYVSGDGFAQSEYQTGIVFPDHAVLLSNLMGATIKVSGGTPGYSYQPFTNDFSQYVTMVPEGPLATSNQYAVGNACIWGNDVLDIAAVGAIKSGEYQSAGSNIISGVYFKPTSAGNHYESYLDGWDIKHLFAVTGGYASSYGRIAYYFDLFTKIAAQSGCSVQGTPTSVLGVGTDQSVVDYMMVKNNVLRSGVATVDFGLARSDRVQIRIYDVAGRSVRTLANRFFTAGPHSMPWDGTDDSGVQLARGVYFAQVRYATSKFTDAKRLIVLK